MASSKITIKLPPARLSFANLVKPKTDDNGDEKWSCSLIFRVGEDLSELKEAIESVAQDAFNDSTMPPGCKHAFAGKWEKALSQKNGYPLLDQGDKEDKYKGYEEGGIYCSPATKFAPGLVERQSKERPNEPVEKEDADKLFYPGAWVRAQVTIYSVDFKDDNNTAIRSVSIGLNGLQFLKHGERLDERPDPTKAFEGEDDLEDDFFDDDDLEDDLD